MFLFGSVCCLMGTLFYTLLGYLIHVQKGRGGGMFILLSAAVAIIVLGMTSFVGVAFWINRTWRELSFVTYVAVLLVIFLSIDFLIMRSIDLLTTILLK